MSQAERAQFQEGGTDMTTDEILSDETQLARLGYRQKLGRTLRLWPTFSLGFTYMAPSLAIGLFAYGLATGGPAFVWTIPLVFVGQMFVVLTFAEAASQWPLAGGMYQWSKNLVGPRYGWFTAWLYLWAVLTAGPSAATAAIAFVGPLFGISISQTTTALVAAAMIAISLAVNLIGSKVLGRVAVLGVAAEIIGVLVFGTILLVAGRHQSVSTIFTTAGVGHGDYIVKFLPAGLMAVWILFGFENCGAVAEETLSPSRRVPRAMILTLTIGAAAVFYQILAYTLGVGNYSAVIDGKNTDPAVAVLSNTLGATGLKFALAAIVIAFVSCVIAGQAGAIRSLYALGRDRVLVGGRYLSYVSPRTKMPPIAVITASVISGAICLLPVSTVAYLATFLVVGAYCAFQSVVLAALIARVKGWKPTGTFRLGRFGPVVNIMALVYGVGAIVVLCDLTPPLGTGFFNRWLVPISVGIVGGAGLLYLFIFKPHVKVDADDQARELVAPS